MTPSKGSYLQYTGRQSVDDLVDTNPDRLFQEIKVNSNLEERGEVERVIRQFVLPAPPAQP